MIRVVMLLAFACGCTVIYDGDEFEICAEIPEFPDPPCAEIVLTCLTTCSGEECDDCYDANGNGEFEDDEVRCFECALLNFYRCFADSGCAREVEQVFCCSEALCGPFGCSDTDNPCESENTGLNACISALPDPTVCNASGLSCFPPP